MEESARKERLMSLDVLRGLDMIYLTIAYLVIRPLLTLMGKEKGAAYNFLTTHPWEGFSGYDIIMPMFIFMCGAAIPFALGKRMDADGRPAKGFWRHVFSRAAVLWVLGMASQGKLLTFDIDLISIFCNTLQTIAVGYVITAAAMCARRRCVQYAVTAALPIGYGIAMAVWGDYGEHTNLAVTLDRHICALIYPASSKWANPTTTYTWFATVPMFGFMSLCGFHATNVIRSAAGKWRKAGVLGMGGLAMLAAGLVAERCGIPCIKHVFTFSFTLQAMGWCVLMLDALYVIIDVLGFRRGWWLAVLYGQTSLAAYMLDSVLNGVPQCAAVKLASGLADKLPERARPLVLGLAAFAVITFCLHVWRCYKQASAAKRRSV